MGGEVVTTHIATGISTGCKARLSIKQKDTGDSDLLKDLCT